MSAMYLTNKYTRWYYNIIQRAQTRVILDYSERHHIIPKSLGGSNAKNNLVRLTAREHFICHWLLIKMVSDRKDKARMQKALERMTVSTAYQFRYKINSRLFEQIRKNAAVAHSILLTGKNGRTHSQETKNKISQKAIGRIGTFTGKTHTKESLNKMQGPRPNFIPHNKGKTDLPSSSAAKHWSILNTYDNSTIIVLSLRKWAKDNYFNCNTVDNYVRRFGCFKNYQIKKLQ
jgi:hypothetical protein